MTGSPPPGSPLAPACAVTLGGQRWTSQALDVDVLLAAAPLVGTARARLPAGAPVEAAPGDSVVVELDSGEAAATVFTGTVSAVRREFGATVVTAVDAAGALARYRPATTYEKVNAGTVIRALAADVGVGVGAVDDGVALAFYVADPARTALDHVARLAAWSAALVRVDAEGNLIATAVGALQADLAPRYGREVLALAQTTHGRDVEAFTVAGEAGAGSTSAPEALRPTSDFFAGRRPNGPDATHRWRFEPALRTTGAGGTAGAATEWRYRAGRRTGSITMFPQPALRPGSVIEVADPPDPLVRGPFWLDRVRHRFGAAGAYTTARWRTGGPAFSPLAAVAGSAASGRLGG
ncbi:hypothetical protein [Frankia gtarii]|uniref:hypothetical protein n=1 Tax=Frankia gtarii TaxID=2950102 RepID=UPI0021C0A45E|nr:hypothetical protein [Frankia gtarii]